MASIGAHDALVEQFAQGEGATGRAAADFVEQATSALWSVRLGELWTWKDQILEHDLALGGHLALLRVFAHGTLPEYRAALASGAALPALPAQEPARQLTVATMAERAQTLRYDDLMAALEVPAFVSSKTSSSTSISPGLARGKLDQRRACFEVQLPRPRYPTGATPRAHRHADAWRETPARAIGRRGEGSMGERRAGEGVSA